MPEAEHHLADDHPAGVSAAPGDRSDWGRGTDGYHKEEAACRWISDCKLFGL